MFVVLCFIRIFGNFVFIGIKFIFLDVLIGKKVFIRIRFLL